MRYVIYADHHRPPDIAPRCYVPVFTDIAVACAWLDQFLDGEQYTREGERINLESGPRLRCADLDRILNCVDRSSITNEQRRLILRFKYGTWEEVHRRTDDTCHNGTKSALKPERHAKAQRPNGYITITELCVASGMPAINARAILRASGRVKPEYGWAFDPGEIPAIKKLCGME